MLSSTVPRVTGAALVLVLGWGLAALVGRGVTLLLGTVGFQDSARRGAVALVRLVTLMVVLDLLGRLTPVPVGLAMLIVGWLGFRSGGPPVAPETERWAERPAEQVAAAPPVAAGDHEGRLVRSAYDRRRLARPGPERRGAGGRA